MKKGEISLGYIDGLIDELRPEPVFNKRGKPIKHDFFELPMSNEAVALAVTQGWKHNTVYSRDKKTWKLVPRVVFEMPERSP